MVTNLRPAEHPPLIDLPESVVVTQQTGSRLSPNEIRTLKTDTGKTIEELMGDQADESDRIQTLVWLTLRRQGYEPRWADCGDVIVEFRIEPPDPTKSEPPASSPGSADSGA